MSGYWDAVERAALGLSGSAKPRPWALFEDDFAASDEPFEVDDRERETQSVIPQAATGEPAQRTQFPSSGPAAPSSEPARASDDVAEIVTGPVGATPALPAHSANQVLQAEHRLDSQQFMPLAPVESHSPPPPQIVEVRSEVQRTVVERWLEREVPTAVDRLDSDAPLAKPLPQPAAAEPDEPAQATITVAAAEPLVQPPEPPASIVAADPQPIIIEIDRIDVRIEAPAAPLPVTPRRAEQSGAPSLRDYLEARGGTA